MTMKKNFYSITIVATILSCGQSTLTRNDNDHQSITDTVTKVELNRPNTSIHPSDLFTVHDAEKILGEQAHVTDSSTLAKEDILTYSCAYFANAKDSISGKTGCIYFLFEKYYQIASAKKKYSSIKIANENHDGIKVLDDIGDEAYFHSDGQNFYFIMVRKGKNVFNMKVNKITSKTSLDEFNQIAKNITNAL
jgi:hypothetical protein